MHQINHDNWNMDILAGDDVPERRPDYDRIRKKRDEQRRLANEKHQEWIRSLQK